MSHNITIGCPASLVDLEDELVKSVLEEELKWKILGPGTWTGYETGQAGNVIKAEQRIAVPIGEDASRYGEKLSPEETARLGLQGNYAIVALNSQEGQPQEVFDPILRKKKIIKGPPTMKITMDDHGGKQEVFKKKLMNTIMGVRSGKQVMKAMKVLQQAGEPFVPDEQIVSKIKAGVRTGAKQIVRPIGR